VRPYYEHKGVTIYHGDCREVLPVTADFVLTDPPYGIAYDASHSKYKNGIDRGVAEWDIEPFDPSPIIALDLPTIIWGGNCFSSRLPDASSWIAWVKIARQDADIRQSDCELAWTNCLGRSRVFTHLWIGAYRESESGLRNYHPTQKPVALMKWCLQQFPEAQDILDPFMGSGTTLRAAKDLGRRAIGIEIEEKYCEIAAKRLSQEVLEFT
jgi:site-specific DNA-methyltransferase (adenine-specific)